jgi:hypothetical protein
LEQFQIGTAERKRSIGVSHTSCVYQSKRDAASLAGARNS